MLLSVTLRAVGRRLKATRSMPVSLSPRGTSTLMESGGASSDWGVEDKPHPATGQRLLRAAVLGLPNAGKTTLVNQLVGRKVFAVSPKRHTTTRSVVGVLTEGNSQILLTDTPGVVPYQLGRKLRAPKSFLTGPQRSLMEAEMVMVVVDASDKKKRDQLNKELLKTLSQYSHIPTILLLNKVDAVRHKHVLLHITDSITETFKEWMAEEKRKREERSSLTETPTDFHSTTAEADDYTHSTGDEHAAVGPFREVFMISALTGDGVEDLRDYLLVSSQPGQWDYSVAEYSDQSQMALAEDIVREKLFLHLHREIPYVLTQNNVVWEKEGDTQIIYQNITCRSSNQASIVIGPGGSTVQTITEEARTDMEALLGCPVDLTLNVRSQK